MVLSWCFIYYLLLEHENSTPVLNPIWTLCLSIFCLPSAAWVLSQQSYHGILSQVWGDCTPSCPTCCSVAITLLTTPSIALPSSDCLPGTGETGCEQEGDLVKWLPRVGKKVGFTLDPTLASTLCSVKWVTGKFLISLIYATSRYYISRDFGLSLFFLLACLK